MSTVIDVVEPRLLNAEITEDEIIAHLMDGRTISVPLIWSWRLSEATSAQRQNFEILGDGQGLHCPDIDEDISVEACCAVRQRVACTGTQHNHLITNLFK